MDCSWDAEAFLTQVNNLPDHLRYILVHGSNSEFLDALSTTTLDPNFTDHVIIYFERLLPDICARWESQNISAIVPAFARILPFAPHLAELAEQKLGVSEGGSELLHRTLDTAQAPESSVTEFLIGIYRLLLFDNASFAKLVRPTDISGLLKHQNRAIRYLAIRVLCLYVPASDATMETMISKYVGDDLIDGEWSCRKIDYIFFSLWEQNRLNDLSSRLKKTRDQRSNIDAQISVVRIIDDAEWSTNVCNMFGTLLIRSTESPDSFLTDYVSIPSTVENTRALSKALTELNPILLIGPAGSGKTMTVRHVAERLNKTSKMVTLHLNKQSDMKMLIGIYTSGMTPGSFEWQPGVLTRAVAEGRWLFIEDLDHAPDEVLAAILPLIERRELPIPNRGKVIKAPRSFRIIATMRSFTNLHGEEFITHSKMLGKRLWKRIEIIPPGLDGVADIIQARFPVLIKFIPRITQVYEALHRQKLQSSVPRTTPNRQMTPRDLFKWCRRIQGLLGPISTPFAADIISDTLIDDIFLEAVDCFSGHIPEDQHRLLVSSNIAESLHIDSQRMEYILRDRKVIYDLTINGPNQYLRIGRVKIPRTLRQETRLAYGWSGNQAPFATDAHTCRLLERLAAGVINNEPMLLVGETGLGKTTVVQHLAESLGHKLVVVNLSQQSETGDLLGGFKPVSIRSIVVPMKDEFDTLFELTFSYGKNRHFLQTLCNCFSKSQWKRVVRLWKEALKMVEDISWSSQLTRTVPPPKNTDILPKKRKAEFPISAQDLARWEAFSQEVKNLELRLSAPQETFNFSYVEGNLIRAVRNGYWILLDEINLATSDTLECISDLLEDGSGPSGSILLTETGKLDRIKAHPEFRIFGSMNPATDVGKRDLPLAFRSRFTEIYVESPDNDIKSLTQIVRTCMSTGFTKNLESKLPFYTVSLYQTIQQLTKRGAIVDGSGQRPHYSLRTLIRAIGHANKVAARCNLRRGLFEGFSLCFLTCLDDYSEKILLKSIRASLFTDAASVASEIRKPLRKPDSGRPYIEVTIREESLQKGKRCVNDFRHWIPRGQFRIEEASQYIITPYIRRNLENLIRAVSTERLPVLIQGPTSAGKTSMVEHLAKISGNRFIRINNHEHTDLQEYVGTYVSTSSGQLVFQEGVLVQALRHGHWVVLDELNLAPSDVLEALNRLLDDNRELLIPETQETVRPHPDFMLFATQNPAGPYGGRKILSRAFRNRFLELHFDNIPVEELSIILARRSQIPESWCRLVVEVYKRLSQLRQEERLFEHDSFATLRDLFRWTTRTVDNLEQLAVNGYMLLAEKVRRARDKNIVKEIITEVMSRKGIKIQINEDHIYQTAQFPGGSGGLGERNTGIIWTKAMRRLYTLVSSAIKNNEPVLLVGETGSGKTTVCQLLADAMNKTLHIVNAQQNTETSDLIGAQRPIRNHSNVELELMQDLHRSFAALGVTVNADIFELEEGLRKYDTLTRNEKQNVPIEIRTRLEANRNRRKMLFEWCDGSLVKAMKAGDFYLLDEISLADDSVLERMNSVLDPQRTLLLAEKGSSDAMVIAQHGFQFLATMNPGGDFGKKELSPALRNRFTEIWVPAMSDHDDILAIVHDKLNPNARKFATPMVKFAQWFCRRFRNIDSDSVSIRDILTWIEFVNISVLELHVSIVHGAAMVFFDTLGADPSAIMALIPRDIYTERLICLEKLSELFGFEASRVYTLPLGVSPGPTSLKIGEFSIAIQHDKASHVDFNFSAPTPTVNSMRVLRALQLSKPILLEGEPGVGKTSLITAIANITGNSLTRMNLSEQTDLMDLFGSDTPSTNAGAGHFSWRDGPFLSAMKSGHWVLLDEMNLASQSVLEGLNACLDHRGEVYIPELDQTFIKHPDFRLFSAQNPHFQGCGRKGLPTSFVNRFTVVYVDKLKPTDLSLICQQIQPDTDEHRIGRLISFLTDLENYVAQGKVGASGRPWEFNLRDVLRWLQLISHKQYLLQAINFSTLAKLLFIRRFRNSPDQRIIQKLFSSHFPETETACESIYANVSASTVQYGFSIIQRNQVPNQVPKSNFFLASNSSLLQEIMICVQCSWPVILVGASGAGKSKILDTLASLLGVRVEIFAMNSDVDASDIIGGYEQVDRSRKIQKFLRDMKAFLQHLFERTLSEEALSITQERLQTFLEGFSYIATETDEQIMLRTMRGLLKDLEDNFSRATEMLSQCEELLLSSTTESMGKFEWVDGVIIQALQQGNWLVLDNANLCAPSVLDRLNSLLEPDGSLIVNENCHDDGSPRIITPHPDFRIFLTMDPQHGELSQAMRNRAVELFIPAAQTNDELESHWNVLSSVTVEASMSRFHRLVELDILASDSEDLETIVDCYCDNTSLADQAVMVRFCDQAADGLVSERLSDYLYQRCQFHQALKPGTVSVWAKELEDYYQTMQNRLKIQGDFYVAQALYALANRPLAIFNHISSNGNHHPIWLGTVFDLFVESSKCAHAINSTRYISSSDPSVQKSASSIKKIGSFRTRNDPTSAIATFLLKSQNAITEWYSHAILTGPDLLPFIHLLEDFQAYWWALLSLLDTQEIDRTYLQPLQTLGRQALRKANYYNEGFVSLIDRVNKYLDALSEEPGIKTGLSMERLWMAFRPPVPQTMAKLDALLHLEQLSDRFDSIVWQIDANLVGISELSASIGMAITICRTTEADTTALAKHIETSISRLSSTIEHIDSAARPYFEPEFEAVCQILDLHRLRESPSAVLKSQAAPTLTLLACRAAKSASTDETQSDGSRLLSNFVNFSGTVSRTQTSMVTESQIHIALCQKISNLGTVSARNLGLLAQEVALLGKVLSRQSKDICEDKNRALGNFLKWIKQIILESHNDIAEAHHSEHIDTFSSCLSERPEHYFCQIANKYFQLPSLENHQLASSESIADNLIRFAIGLILLYVPAQAFDPILKSTLDKWLYDERKLKLKRRHSALKFIEREKPGLNVTGRIKSIEETMASIGHSPSVPSIARPKLSELNGLQVEFSIVMRIVLTISQQLESDALCTDEEVLKNISQAISRLANNHRVYDDLTAPVVGYLSCLKVGVLMKKHSTAKEDQNTSLGRIIFRQTPFMDAQPGIWNLSMANNDILDSHTLRIAGVLHAIHDPVRLRASVKQTIMEIFHNFFTKWRSELRSNQQRLAASTNLYHYRGHVEDDDVDEDIALSELFPNSEENSTEDQFSNPHIKTSQNANTSNLLELHENIFRRRQEDPAQIIPLLELSFRLISDPNIAIFNDPDANGMKKVLPALLLAMQRSQVDFSSINRSQPTYDIYTHANVFEISNFIRLVKSIQGSFRQIQSFWPDHSTVLNVIALCDDLLTLQVEEPLIKIFPRAEKMHANLAEWQSVASSESSVAEYYKSLTDLLISWRQLELTTWSQLLDNETKKWHERANDWWYIAYENLIAIPMAQNEDDKDQNTYVESMVLTLDKFLISSSHGDYAVKLRLFRTLLEQIKMLAIDRNYLKPIQVALSNLEALRSKFEPLVHVVIQKGRNAIEKEVKDVIKLASWKDRNLDALRQSARTNRFRLLKLVRKYRAVLSQPIDDIIKQELPDPIESHVAIQTYGNPGINENVSKISSWVSELQGFHEFRTEWSLRPLRFKNVSDTVSLMQKRVEYLNHNVNGASRLHSFLDNVMLSVQSLRDSTPDTKTEENASLIKHLLTRKRKVFFETLREIRRMGLNSNPTSSLKAQQSSIEKVMASLPAIPSCSETWQVEFCRDFLNKTIIIMSDVRRASSDHSADLNIADTNRCIGYFENLLALTIKQQQMLINSAENLRALQSKTKECEATCQYNQNEVFLVDSKISARFQSVERALAWLPTIIDCAITLLEAQAGLGEIDFSAITNYLHTIKSMISDCHNKFQSHDNLLAGFANYSQTLIISAAADMINEFAQELMSLSDRFPSAQTLISHIQSWTSLDSYILPDDNRTSLHISLSDFNMSFYDILDLMLICVQDLGPGLQHLNTDPENTSWLLEEDKYQSSAIKALNLHRISERFSDLLGKLQDLQGDDLKAALASIACAMPIIKQYQDICVQHIRAFAILHCAVAKTTYQLGKIFSVISMQGFCSPSEKSNDPQGKSDQLESGTGLGVGDGAEDISKEIDNDEDLSELAQEQNESNGEQELENQEDAVEIDDQPHGESNKNNEAGSSSEDDSEASGGEGEAIEDDGDQNEGEDRTDKIPNEALGNIDDKDPAKVDEKLWDQAADEIEKQNQSQKSVGEKDQKNIDAAIEQETRETEDLESARDEPKSGENEDVDESMSSDVSEARTPEELQSEPTYMNEIDGLDLPEELQLDGDKDGGPSPAEDSDDEADASEMDIPDDNDAEKVNDSSEALANSETSEQIEDTKTTLDNQPHVEPNEEVSDPKIDIPEAQQPSSDNQNSGEGSGAGKRPEMPQDKEIEGNKGETEDDVDEMPLEDSSVSPARTKQSMVPDSKSLKSRQTPGSKEGEQADQIEKPDRTLEQEILRQLGSALEKWHRQQKEIRDADKDTDDEKSGTKDFDNSGAEFEHILDDPSTIDTQALGASTNDQAQALNDNMAIIEEDLQPDYEMPDADKSSTHTDMEIEGTSQNEDGPENFSNAPEFMSSQAFSNISDRSDGKVISEMEELSTDEDMQSLKELEDNFSTVDFQRQQSAPQEIQADAFSIWQGYESRISALAHTLTGHLRLILEPSLSTKLRGDFRTGKRLNIKRIIPYIASSYKRDKIWMRRSVPSKRAYQILLAIDDSKSMAENGSKELAFECLALVARSLTTLEVGELGVLSFGQSIHIAHELSMPWTANAGANCVQQFDFQQQRTNVQLLVQESIKLLRNARMRVSAGSGGSDLWQLEVIISDGICEDHEAIRRMLLTAHEERIMIIFVIVDAVGEGRSILDLDKVEFVHNMTEDGKDDGEMHLQRKKYLETFPFKYHLVVRNVRDLPVVLATALRQWFAEVAER